MPTDLGFTGQRSENFGLYDYHARFYSPALGRFISADTLVPNPASPGDFNRYAYVRNNPLRYVDPTGHLTDEEITHYLGVKTWKDVRALFQEGGTYEGRWGWLETLRRAELGDEIQIYENYAGSWPPPGPDPARMVLRGTLTDWEGQLNLQSGDTLIAGSEAAWMGNAYFVSPVGSDPRLPPAFGPFYAGQVYGDTGQRSRLKWDRNRVDGIDVANDFVGGILSIGEAGGSAPGYFVSMYVDVTGFAYDIEKLKAKD